jgi:hypothetical protein
MVLFSAATMKKVIDIGSDKVNGPQIPNKKNLNTTLSLERHFQYSKISFSIKIMLHQSIVLSRF